MGQSPTILLHLSDVHLRRGLTGTTFDPDSDIRAQLELDVMSMRERLGAIHAIIVSGDIAFSGGEEEYAYATTWLKKLCGMLHCPEENVWTVPGNHDVDRRTIARSRQLQLLHDDIRRGKGSIDDRIRMACFEDHEAATSLFKPLENYNRFARPLQCDVGPKVGPNNEEKTDLYWEHKLDLHDGTIVRLRGMTSTLVSDESDSEGDNRLVLGTVQATVPEEDGTVNIAVCHHPPEWLLDRDAVDDRFRNRTKIQLLGHKHSARSYMTGNSLRISAGAVHPDRSESGWMPTYNILAMELEASPEHRTLNVTLYPRIWSEANQRFKGDMTAESHDSISYHLQLEMARMPARTVDSPKAVEKPILENEVSVLEESKNQERVQFVNPARKLIYRFLSLPYLVRLEIARDLGLIHEEDANLTEGDLYPKYFARAKESQKLENLWNEVEKRHGSKDSENPFVGQ